jgi:lysophospholipase L1-like esterase/chitodextrinase
MEIERRTSMKRVRRLTLVFILLWSLLAASLLSAADGQSDQMSEVDPIASQSAVNLLENGDFETGDADPWIVYTADADEEDALLSHTVSSAVYTLDNQHAFTLSSLHIASQYEIRSISQTVTIQPSQWLTFQTDLYLQSMSGTLVTMLIEFLDSEGEKIVGAYMEHNIYKALEDHDIGVLQQPFLRTLAPPNATYAKAHIILKSGVPDAASGTILVDNVQLIEEWSPRELRATDVTDTSMFLAWTEPAGGITPARYHIYQNDTVIDSVYGDQTTYSVTGLRPATGYTFTVTAEALSGSESVPGNALHVVTDKRPGTTTIMPLGDSLTLGKFYDGGYRGFLWQQLRQAGLDADFVGSQDANPYGIISGIEPDNDHEGHSGYTAEQIADLAHTQTALYKPDIILLMAGTNDMFDPSQRAAAGQDMNKMLNQISEALPNTQVVMSSIPPIMSDPDLLEPIQRYNQQIKEIAADHRAQGHPVGFVDMYALMKEEYFPLDPEDSNKDGIHPTREAFEVMGHIWFDAVQAIMTDGHVSFKDPTRPANIAHSFNANGSATLTWTASADNVAIDHYEILNADDQWISSTTQESYTTSPLLADSPYTYKVVAVDTSANRSQESITSFMSPPALDSTPPMAPTHVNVYDFTHDEIMLEWKAADNDVAYYEIQVDNKQYTTTDTTFTVTGLHSMTEYELTVVAVDRASNPSVGNITVKEMTLPLPIADLVISEQTSSSVRLSWTASTESKVNNYEVSINEAAFVTTGEASYIDEELTSGQVRHYRVAAIDNLGRRSLFSNEVVATIDKPNTPSKLTASQITDHSFDLTWEAVPSAQSYKVVIMEGASSLNVTKPGTSHTFLNLKPLTSYKVRVIAVDVQNNESAAAQIEVVTKKSTSGTGYTSYPSGSLPPPTGKADPVDQVEYTGEDGHVKLAHTPNIADARTAMNGTETYYSIQIPSDKPYQQLRLTLSGEIILLAAERNKTILIDGGNWTLELPPDWVNASASDQLVLTMNAYITGVLDAAYNQALEDRSDAYDFAWTINDIPIHRFKAAIRLSIVADDGTHPQRAGIFYYNALTDYWEYVGGMFTHDHTLSIELKHFSIYGVFESVKTFEDIASHWARSDIEALAAKQIVSGITDQLYQPKGDITRAQFAAMLTRALKLKALDSTLPFSDVPEDAWYANDIRASYQNGLIKGVNDDRFAPNERISREQMAIMITNAYMFATSGSFEQFDESDQIFYADDDQISSWALAHVRAASSLGLLHGIDGSFEPEQDANRAQAAAVIQRLLLLLS